MSDDERPLLAAVIGPLPAAIVDRELGATFRQMAIGLRAQGNVAAAQQFSSAAAQARESARQWMERTSPRGSAELPQALAPAESGLAPWCGTKVAAEKLRISPRQVRYLITAGRLSAVTEAGRKLIDPASLAIELDRRGASDDRGEDTA